jgi:hypothetical protein
MPKKVFTAGSVLRAADVNEYLTTSRNVILNADFAINQRVFTSTTVNTAYGHDRWSLETGSGTSTYSTQAFTPGAAPVAGYEASNFARIVTSGQTGTVAYSLLQQHVEDVRTFAGQTVTVSFWAKAGSGTPKIAVSLDQRFGSGGSPSAIVTTPVGTATLSTVWARYSVSVDLPDLTGKTIGTTANTSSLLLRLWVSGSAALDPAAQGIGIQNNTFDIWGIQLEEGSTATPFSRATPTIQSELAACQRYYQEFTPTMAGTGTGSGSSIVSLNYLVPLRINPGDANITVGDGAIRIGTSEVGCSTTAVASLSNTSAWIFLGHSAGATNAGVATRSTLVKVSAEF